MSETVNNHEKVTIRIDLEGELAKQFLELKKSRGVLANSEVIRMLIVEEFQRKQQILETIKTNQKGVA
jgi:hypothetical protein